MSGRDPIRSVTSELGISTTIPYSPVALMLRSRGVAVDLLGSGGSKAGLSACDDPVPRFHPNPKLLLQMVCRSKD